MLIQLFMLQLCIVIFFSTILKKEQKTKKKQKQYLFNLIFIFHIKFMFLVFVV